MRRRSFLTRAVTLGISGVFLFALATQAAEVRVVSSGGFAAAYRALAPEFERSTDNTLVTSWGPSMGDTPEAVPGRFAAWRADRCRNHGRLRAWRSGQAREG